MAVSSYGSSTSSSGVVHPQGSRPRYRRPRRPDRGGHRRLRSHPVLAAAQPGHPGTKSLRVCTLLRKPDAVAPMWTSPISASTSPTSSSWATGSTMPSATGICRCRNAAAEGLPALTVRSGSQTAVTEKLTVCSPGCSGRRQPWPLRDRRRRGGVPPGASEIRDDPCPGTTRPGRRTASPLLLASSNARARASATSAESSRWRR